MSHATVHDRCCVIRETNFGFYCEWFGQQTDTIVDRDVAVEAHQQWSMNRPVCGREKNQNKHVD